MLRWLTLRSPSAGAKSPRTDTASAAAPAAPPAAIVVDHRERAGGLIDALDALEPRLEFTVETLPVGDVVLGGTFGIERKRTDDFCASLVDGRLFHQLGAMADAFPERLLVVEGEFTGDTVGGLGGRALRGAMASVMLDWRVPLVRTRDAAETAGWIALLHERRRRPLATRPRREGPKDVVAQAEPDIVRAMVLAIEGLGPARADALVARFPTVASLLAASPADLEATPGVGRELAQRIHALLHPQG